MSGNEHHKHNNTHFPIHFRMLLADWFTFNRRCSFIRPSVRRRHHHRLLFRLGDDLTPQPLKHVFPIILYLPLFLFLFLFSIPSPSHSSLILIPLLLLPSIFRHIIRRTHVSERVYGIV